MLKTEKRNPNSTHIDKMDTIQMLKTINDENYNSVRAVEKAIPEIAKATDAISVAFENGGRLFFLGAGTSGRLGIMDAAECPPTYGVSKECVQGIIAGGKECVFVASEGAEDNLESGARDVTEYGVKAGDVLVGISVAGGADYVVGAMQKAKSLGATVIALTCNENTKIEKESDICIITDTGAEVITGSTRMKAGSAHKMVLNMLTTAAMVKTGKVYENMMINVKPSNAKLKKRVIGIVCEILGVDEELAVEYLEKNDWSIRKTVEENKK